MTTEDEYSVHHDHIGADYIGMNNKEDCNTLVCRLLGKFTDVRLKILGVFSRTRPSFISMVSKKTNNSIFGNHVIPSEEKKVVGFFVNMPLLFEELWITRT